MIGHTWHRQRRHGLAWAAAACCSLAQAQGSVPGSTDPAADLEKLERITVTGSNIRRADGETALPVQVITAEDIRRSGKASVTEVLQSLSANGANGLTDSASFNSFAYGASGISLRSLGPTSTLILVNGRRVVPCAQEAAAVARRR